MQQGNEGGGVEAEAAEGMEVEGEETGGGDGVVNVGIEGAGGEAKEEETGGCGGGLAMQIEGAVVGEAKEGEETGGGCKAVSVGIEAARAALAALSGSHFDADVKVCRCLWCVCLFL